VPGRPGRIRVVDAEGRPLPPGERGEIEIGGPSVMIGYFHAPEATGRVLRNGWLRTGDIGSLDEDGYLHFHGLWKPICSIHGNNIDCVEVAAVIRRLDGVADAEVTPLRGERDGLPAVTLAARVTPKPGVELTARDIRAWCRSQLASYKVPGNVELAGAG
jgi:acyl-CoA synthetase (AMP-forming)/AMP-acid ligase II